MKKSKVGLALGSGSARGLAHLGVLKVLEKEKIPIDMIAGTSIGSLIGGAYASGMSLEEGERIAISMDWKQLGGLVDPVIPRSGFIEGNKVKAFIKILIKDKKIEELKIPFAAVATDIKTGEKVVIRHGSLVEAIRASASIPGIFTPVKRGNRFLVDGGLADPVPISVLKKMGADIIIAVNVITKPDKRIITKKVINKPSSEKRSPLLIKQTISMLKKMNSNVINSKISELLKEGLINKGKIERVMNSFRNKKEVSSPNIITIISQLFGIAEARIVEYSLMNEKVDVLIEPDVRQISFIEFNRAAECIYAGEMAAQSKIEEIKIYTKTSKVNIKN